MRRLHVPWISTTLALPVALALAACSGGGGTPPDTTGPTVTSRSPSSGATVAATLAAVTATFSEPVDALTVTGSTFTVAGVAGTVSYDAGTRTATFTPASPLAANTTYTATVTTGVKDAAGNAMAADDTWSFTTAATPGFLDPAFGSGGKVVTSLGASFERARALAVQADGKIVVAGEVWNGSAVDIGVARYEADGTLDPGFGTGGTVVTSVGATSDFANGVAIQPDGKIVVVGGAYDGTRFAFVVVRYSADGSLDTSFDGDGIVTTSFVPGLTSDTAEAVAIQPDGKIVVGGDTRSDANDYDFALVRYTSAGALDTAFGTGGMVTTAISTGVYYDGIRAAALQGDGKIVAAGTGRTGDFAAARYGTTGSLDTSFHGDGMVQTSVGIGTSDSGSDMLVQPDGKIVVVGTTYDGAERDLAVLRYTAAGALDTGFGGATGRVLTAVGPMDTYGLAIARQADGKLVAVGETRTASGIHFALARYLADGSLDPDFGNGGTAISIEGTAWDVAILADGAILVAGAGYDVPYTSSHFTLARYLP